jgi:hypothetical protein
VDEMADAWKRKARDGADADPPAGGREGGRAGERGREVKREVRRVGREGEGCIEEKMYVRCSWTFQEPKILRTYTQRDQDGAQDEKGDAHSLPAWVAQATAPGRDRRGGNTPLFFPPVVLFSFVRRSEGGRTAGGGK